MVLLFYTTMEVYTIPGIVSLKDLLDANPRLHLEFLPPYSPNLNKIEQFWGWLKSAVINNANQELKQDEKSKRGSQGSKDMTK